MHVAILIGHSVGFLGMWPVQLHGVLPSEGSHVQSSVFCGCHLAIIIKLIFDFVFYT